MFWKRGVPLWVVIFLLLVVMLELRWLLTTHSGDPPAVSALTTPPQLSDAQEELVPEKVPRSAQDDTDAPANSYQMVIHVFTYNRLTGLRRLLNSLLQTDYMGHRVILKIFCDFPKERVPGRYTWEIHDYLRSFQWSFGPFFLHRREVNAGLKRSIMEAWYPTTNNEVGAFFEDDIEVSPLWYKWAVAALQRYAPVGRAPDPQLLGVSLFRPIHDELSGKKSLVENGHRPYLLQQPCSWGAVFLPTPWRHFRDWYNVNREKSPDIDVSFWDGRLPTSNLWDSKTSWKKYLIRLMFEEGLLMLYVNLPGTKVLSTNHLMKGEHPTPPRMLFELPLLEGPERTLTEEEAQSLRALPAPLDLRVYDLMFHRVTDRTSLSSRARSSRYRPGSEN